MADSRPLVERVDFEVIRELRQAHRDAAGCQIVRDSIRPRELADPWAIHVDGEVVGYAGVWREHFPGRLMEFVLSPTMSGRASDLFRAVVEATGSEEMECQTNVPLLASMFHECATAVVTENLLFEDVPGAVDASENPRGAEGWTFRARRDGDAEVEGAVPEGPWVVDDGGRVVGAGGILTHYNPPYGDVYMEVAPDARGKGIGRFLVGRLRGVAREQGLVPAARCGPSNEASLRTLLAGGMRRSGEILSGRVSMAYRRGATPGRS